MDVGSIQKPHRLLDDPWVDGKIHLNPFLAHVQSESCRIPHGSYLREERLLETHDDALAL